MLALTGALQYTARFKDTPAVSLHSSPTVTSGSECIVSKAVSYAPAYCVKDRQTMPDGHAGRIALCTPAII